MKRDTRIHATFPQTAWSSICRIDDDPAERRRRLERLCKLYWRPVFTVVRLFHGLQDADARDLTQSYFTWLLEGKVIEKFDPGRGRFRTFIRSTLTNHVRKAMRRRPPPGPQEDPGETLDRAWIAHVLDAAIEESRALLARRGHDRAVDFMLRHDGASDSATYASLARESGMTVARVQKELRHARDCVREVVRERVRETVSNPEDLADELRFVFRG